MAITQVGTAQTGTGENAATMLTFDVSLQEGDVVYVIGGAFNSPPVVVTPGYTLVASQGSGVDELLRVYRKVMGATPDANVTGNISTVMASWVAFSFRGVDPTTPEDATATTAASNDPPSIVTVTNGAVVLACATEDADDATPGQPSGYSTVAVAHATGEFTNSTVGCFKTVASFGTEDPGAFSGWAGHAGAASVAIRPLLGSSSVVIQVANHGTFVSKRVVHIVY